MFVFRFLYHLSIWGGTILHELGHAIAYLLLARSLPGGHGWVSIGIGLHFDEKDPRITPGSWTWVPDRSKGFCDMAKLYALSLKRQRIVLVAGPLVQFLSMFVWIGFVPMIDLVVGHPMQGTWMIVEMVVLLTLMGPWVVAQMVALTHYADSGMAEGDFERFKVISQQIKDAKRPSVVEPSMIDDGSFLTWRE